jgi:hypothetical protein
MRGKMKEKQHSPKIFRADFIPMETLLKESPKAKKRKKRKGNQSIGMPNKPNRKTKITNQLRLNSKALFKPSLKDPQPIVIEDDDDSPEFSSMEEMVVHTLKKMTGDKRKLEFCKGEASRVQLATVKTEYPADSSLQQDARDFGPYPKQDSDGIFPHAEVSPKQHIEDIKPKVKVNIS